MNSMSSNGYRMRVVRGMHTGAIVDLTEGDMIVGSGTDGDVVLMDNDVAPEHARIQVGSGMVNLTGLAGQVRVNGQLLEEGALSPTLQRGDEVELGSVTLALEAPDGIADDGPRSGANKANTAGEDSEAGWLAKVLHYCPPLANFLANNPRATAVAWLKRRRGMAQIAVLVLGVLTLLAWTGSALMAQAAQANTTQLRRHDVSRVRNWLRGHSMNDLSVNQTGGGLMVSGTIATAGQAGQLKKMLRGLKTDADSRVEIGGDVSLRAQTLFAQLGAPAVDIQQIHGNTYRASGYAGTAAHWAHVREMVLHDMQSIGSLETGDLETAQQRQRDLSNKLADKGLKKDIFLRVNKAGTLVATGVVNNHVMHTWKAVSDHFRQTYPDGPQLKSHVRSTSELLGLEVRSVSLGPVSYIVASDGQRFIEGSRLPSGFYVRTIKADAITVAKQGQRFVYQLGE